MFKRVLLPDSVYVAGIKISSHISTAYLITLMDFQSVNRIETVFDHLLGFLNRWFLSPSDPQHRLTVLTSQCLLPVFSLYIIKVTLT